MLCSDFLKNYLFYQRYKFRTLPRRLGLRWHMNHRPNPREMGVLASFFFWGASSHLSRTHISVVLGPRCRPVSHRPERERERGEVAARGTKPFPVAVRLAPPAIQPAGLGSEVVPHRPVLPAPSEIRAAGAAPGLGSGLAAPTAASGPGFWSCRVSNRGGIRYASRPPRPRTYMLSGRDVV
jgi:hypothetical protein